MTITQLRTFLATARHMSFSRAADELHLTQPAVSAQIVALENSVKTKLFDRMGKKISLTDAGRVTAVAAEDILRRIDEFQAELTDLTELKSGSLKIGASHVVGIYLLPQILADFRKGHPEVELLVRIDSTRHVIDMVLRNELDLAIIGEGSPINDDRLAMKPIACDELIVIAPLDHPLAETGSVTMDELATFPFILPARDSASSESMLEQLRVEGITLHSILELGNVSAIKRAVEQGLGLSIVSRHAVERELKDGRLVSVVISGLRLERHLSLCWHHERRFSKLTTAFIQFIQGRPIVAA